jgi:predicted transcriptional regulator
MQSEENFLSSGKRSRLEIFVDILGFCVVPQTKTRIINKVRLSFKVSTECILQLKRSGLLQDSIGLRKKLVTSEKGFLFLKGWWQLLELLDLEHKPEERLLGRVNGRFTVPDLAMS